LTTSELALVLLSALLHAIWSASIKGSRNATAFNLLQLVPTAIFALLLPIWVSPAAIPSEVWWFVAGTGFFHGFYFYWLGRALETGELSVVYPIARSAPAFLPLVAVPLLGERVSLHGLLGIAIVVLGMWAVQADATRGLRLRLDAPGTRYALLTLAASIGYSMCDKAAMTRLGAAPWDAPIPAAVVYGVLLSVSGGLVFLPLALRRVDLATLRATAAVELRTACVASLVSYAGYALILQALKTAPVSYVVAARQTSVLFAVAIAALQLRERPTRLRVVGALATVVGVALVAQ
jgi:drug/metabolite transporter (DMT)-like permease